MGRFTSSDGFGNDWEIADPQRFNLYTYARNNPLVYVDDSGDDITYASPALQAVVTDLRQQSSTFDEALKGFEGKGAPDLAFEFGDAGMDANGKDKADGVTRAIYGGGQPVQNCSSATDCTTEDRPYYLKSATITINDSLTRDQSGTEDVIQHEVGHANKDRNKPAESSKQSQETKANNGKVPHDDRPEEQSANGFRKTVKKEQQEFRKRQKEEEKRQKQEKKKMKKRDKEEGAGDHAS